jgi:hypothetical protein
MQNVVTITDYKGSVAGSCENGNEYSGSIKGGESLHYLSNYQLLKKTLRRSEVGDDDDDDDNRHIPET